MVSQKQNKKEINLIEAVIALDEIVLDSHPVDVKQGNKVAKRILKLEYIVDGGIVKIPAHLWMFGWIKELFKSKAKGTVVHLPDKLPLYSLGNAKDILKGRTEEDWNVSGDKSVPYEFGAELAPYKLYPYHNYVALGQGKGSIVKYFYKCAPKDKTTGIPVRLEIYTLIPPEIIIDNMKSLGRVYGLGPKADGYRLGTFVVKETKTRKLGEIIV